MTNSVSSNCLPSGCWLPLAEGVQAGQDLGVAVVIQTDAANQKLLVYLTHHWAGAPVLVLRHGGGHSELRTTKSLNLRGGKKCHECHFQT